MSTARRTAVATDRKRNGGRVRMQKNSAAPRTFGKELEKRKNRRFRLKCACLDRALRARPPAVRQRGGLQRNLEWRLRRRRRHRPTHPAIGSRATGASRTCCAWTRTSRTRAAGTPTSHAANRSYTTGCSALRMRSGAGHGAVLPWPRRTAHGGRRAPLRLVRAGDRSPRATTMRDRPHHYRV